MTTDTTALPAIRVTAKDVSDAYANALSGTFSTYEHVAQALNRILSARSGALATPDQLAQARAEGEAAGIERAAKVCDERANVTAEILTDRLMCITASALAVRIRALKEPGQ